MATQHPLVVLIFGPPGSGKGTQAVFISERLGLHHLDTGKLLRSIVYDPKFRADPKVQNQRELSEKGELMEPEWVAQVIGQEARRIAKAGQGLVSSGSPRTLFEVEYLVPLLEELYGKDNLKAFILEVSDGQAIFRNTHRRVCVKCGNIIMWSRETENLKVCPECGHALITRKDDTAEAMRERLREYRNRTEPIFQYLRVHGIGPIPIDGEPSPEEVSREIMAHLEKVKHGLD